MWYSLGAYISSELGSEATVPALSRVYPGRMEIMEWHSRANCLGSSLDFITPKPGNEVEAIALICRSCPVVDQCLEYGKSRPQSERLGVYGGRLFTENATSSAKKRGRPVGVCDHSRSQTRHLSCEACWARRYGFCVDCHQAEPVKVGRCEPCARGWHKESVREWRARRRVPCIIDGCANLVNAEAEGLCRSCSAKRRQRRVRAQKMARLGNPGRAVERK